MISIPFFQRAEKDRKKRFVRTEVPRVERVVSWVIIAALLCIGIGLFIKSRNYDPSRFALNAAALSSTTAEITGKAGTIREEGFRGDERSAAPEGEAGDGYEGFDGYDSAPTESGLPKIPLEVSDKGLTPLGDTEFYNPDNLYEKINGRAPAYLGFGFQQLRSRAFEVDGGYIDLFEFVMDTPVDAFGIYGLERDPEGQPIDFAPDGYGGPMGYFFRQGNVYVQVIASDQSETIMKAARAVALERAAALPVDNTGLGARSRLPGEGLLAATVSYKQADALGQSYLKDVYMADYEVEDGKVTFFVMVSDKDSAQAAFDKFREFSEKFGSVKSVGTLHDAKVFAAESFGSWNMVYLLGDELGGVSEAKTETLARSFLNRVLESRVQAVSMEEEP